MSAKKLLIVDDDPHIRKLLKLYLRSSGFELFEAATGEEADQLGKVHAFDVILLDLILPKYGGFRLCQRFKSAEARAPRVIIMTGDDSPETRATAKDCGADGFLAKPFTVEQIRESLRNG